MNKVISKNIKKQLEDTLWKGGTTVETMLCLAKMIERGDTEVLAHLCQQYGGIVSTKERQKIVKIIREVAIDFKFSTRDGSQVREQELGIKRIGNVIDITGRLKSSSNHRK